MTGGSQKPSEPQIWQQRLFPVALVIGWTAITGIMSLVFFSTLDDSRSRVTNTHDFLLTLEKLLSAAKDAETGQRGYLIVQSESYLAPYQRGLETSHSLLKNLKAMQIDNAAQLVRIATLETLWNEKAEELRRTLDIAREKGIEEARAAVASDLGKSLMDKLRLVTSEMEAAETLVRAEAITVQKSEAQRLFLFTQLTTLSGFGALLYLLAQARRAAAALETEVSSRQSAEDLSRERAEQALRTRVMNRELVHRTKNLISVVQAIVRNQEKGSPDIDRYVEGLSNRLTSLGSTLDILVRENWHQVALEDLIAGQLGHFSEDLVNRIIVTPGPKINFTASEAQMIGLALHELGTNAAKYGALATASGRVEVSWVEDLRDGQPTFVLRWKETDGPAVTPPARRGFGRRITESLVARAVNGHAVIEYPPDGLIWTLSFERDRNSLADDSPAEDSQAKDIQADLAKLEAV